ncbi:MAG: hypothetical protein JNG86_17510, partial [Verrucomicrobiaceae bacterium]|nr:hypothetical protein [Verrucomicrobiaceae bacterium]
MNHRSTVKRVICSIALMATCVMAAPGDLDTSFGPNGILVKDLGGDEQVRGVTLLPDGKMLLAGFSNKQGTYDMTLTRLLADGQPDKAFGTEGMVYTAIGAGDDQARTMIQQVDGRILVGGYSHNGTNYDFALVRYNLDGSLDVTFNATGKVTTAISTGDDFVRSLALQPDGKIVAAGYSVAAGTGTSENVTMARYLPDGALDSSFGVAGKVIISLSTDADFGRSVAVLADGNILVAGEMRPSGGGSTNFFVARLTPGGALDSSFGSGGAVTTDVAGANDTVLTMKLQADGKMVVAGFASTAGNNNFALVRYNPNGTLDTSFNGTGIVSTDINGGGDDQAFGLMIQGDGKLVAAGHANSNMVCVVRYTTGGVLDTTFSIDGKHAFQTGTFSRGHAVAQQADGAVVVVGTSQNGGPGDFLVARLQANGTPDPVFGGAGKVTTAVNSGGEVIYDLALAADGKIVAVGHGQNGATRDFTVARYLQNGVLDVTFGGNGKVQTPIGSGDDDAEAVAIQSDGKIVVAGHTITAARGWDIAVARYNTNGSLDTTFGSGGKMTPSSLGSDARDEYARRVVIDSTGRIFVLYEGIPHLGGTTHFKMQLLCLTNTGAADPSFGTGGWVSVDFGSGHNLPRAMTLQPDGRILVAGIADGNGGYDFALARLTTTGVLDSTFGGGDGKLTVDVGGRDDIARSVIVQSTGRIVVGGHASSGGGPYSFMQLGFDSSGNLDNTFDTDAVVLVPGGSGGALGFGMAVQPDNRIVMAGASISSSEDFGLFRVQANGALDSSFGTAGKVVTPIGGGNDRAYACIIQPDGKIIAAGHAWNGSNDDFALVRYMGNTPVVTTGAADNLGKFSARLNGAVTHNGIPTTARFEYGLTTAYGSSTASQSVGIMGGTVNVNASISGLVANTLYHYRLVAHNGVEDIYGPDATFTTLSDPPAAYTLTAADIGPASSTLIGIVVPGSFDATVTFEYGTTTAYGQTTAPQIFAAGNDFRSVTHGISGLSLGLTYHYRIVASSAGGTTYGLNGTFTTQASSTSPQSAPEVMTGVATNITIQSADVSRSVNPRYGTTFSWFEYGTTTAYGSATLQTSLGNGGAELQSQQTITGLLPGTLYHYRAMASNGLGTTAGLDMTFTTQFLPPVAVTSSAVPAGTTGFTLHGTVNASHALTAVSFEHSTDGTNWSSVPATPASVSGSSNVSVTASLANLSQFTTYFYRVKAQSAGGEVTGSILTLQPQIISGLAQQFPNAPPAANGSLNVTLTPAGILSGWRFTGEQSWRASGETAGGLVHGSRVIEFRPVPGYLQPGSEPVTVNSTGQTADFEYYATPVSGSGGMLVALKPDSIAQAVLVADRAQWRLLGETVWRDSGTSASSLSAGTYLV